MVFDASACRATSRASSQREGGFACEVSLHWPPCRLIQQSSASSTRASAPSIKPTLEGGFAYSTRRNTTGSPSLRVTNGDGSSGRCIPTTSSSSTPPPSATATTSCSPCRPS